MPFKRFNFNKSIYLLLVDIMLLLIDHFNGGWWFHKCFVACLTCSRVKTNLSDHIIGMKYAFYTTNGLRSAEMKLKLPWENRSSLFACPRYFVLYFSFASPSNSYLFLGKLQTVIQMSEWFCSLTFISWFNTHSIM